MTMSMQGRREKARFLTKDEELALGGTIQEHYRAKEALAKPHNYSGLEVEALKAKVVEGEAAVDKLVRANLGLVYDRARIFKTRFPGGPEMEDLVQEGMAGLMTAVSKYDPARGNKFSTLAFYWIAQAVARGANKTGRLVRLPENRINDYSKITSISNSLEVADLTPSELDAHIMKELGLSQTDLMNIRAAAYTPASLNKVVGSDSGSAKEHMDFIADKTPTASSEEHVVQEVMHKALRSAVDCLTDVQRDVIYSIFPLGDCPSLSPQEVQAKHGLQQFKFKRIQVEAVRDLKSLLEANGYTMEDFLHSF